MAHLDHLAPLPSPDGIRTGELRLGMGASHAAHDSRLNDFTIIFTRRALNPFTV